ncbi:MAG: PIG-L family deacetylase [Deltaproteobacteria bacterium]|nr:PIG-L family deacetylase [Deltaproteobacteria bacterium]
MVERFIQAVRQAFLLAFSRRAYLFRLRPRLLRLFDADLAFVAANLELFYPLEPAPVPGLTWGRILVVAAHPDDEAVGAGGSLILAGQGGAELVLAFLTDGRPPSGRAAQARAEASQRQAEAQAAADYLKASVHVFEAPVRTLSADRTRAQEAAAWLREIALGFQPEAVLCPFPLEAHSDHRLAAWAAARAVEDIRPEPLVWAYEVASLCPANVVVDITRVEQKKAELIELYASQTARFDYVNVALGLNRYHSRHLGGRGSAEAFFRVPAGEFVRLVSRLKDEQIFK